MDTFAEDYSQCLAAYLREPPPAGIEGLRDNLYQAYLRLKTGAPAQAALGSRLLEEAPWGPCPYSGVPAVQLLTECGDVLDIRARDRLPRFLQEGRAGWLAELGRNCCNSFRLLAAASLLGCGLLLEDREAAAQAEGALAWIEDHLEGCDLPDEFLSPFYTGLQLSALAEIRALPVAESYRARAARLEGFIWRGVLRHYQPGLLGLAGVYSRGYTSELAGHFQIILACLRRLLGDEAGFTLRATLWSPDYAQAILPHGTLASMQFYALYFAGFDYLCPQEALAAWRERRLPCVISERARTGPSRDVSIKRQVAPNAPWDYPAQELRLTTRLEEGLAVSWSDGEFENGMACPGLQVLYSRAGHTKAFFPKLVRSAERYIGEVNDYPNLGLRLGPSNFPDDGRKTVRAEGEGLRLCYRPRALCRGAKEMKLALIFAAHFSLPDQVWAGDTRVERFDGQERYPLVLVTIRDGDAVFTFEPLSCRGYWQFTCRNRFFHVEWVQGAENFDQLSWEVLVGVTRSPDQQDNITH